MRTDMETLRFDRVFETIEDAMAGIIDLVNQIRDMAPNVISSQMGLHPGELTGWVVHVSVIVVADDE